MPSIWTEKQYNRIVWKDLPNMTTPLGATNLNKIDVFCNNVDNALIQIDAGKLDIATANSMLASVSFDQETGKFTFKELNGTTYEYDLNLEKIPVSFTLTEEGVLIMTTEDGTQWQCNIADLIKDYVFDDSDTIAFEKEFVEEDDDGNGAYHVTAAVKAGSINENHLNPDYRADILQYKNQAQEAANTSISYSTASKRWAVGDSSYEGSATDNSKYYCEQAQAAKEDAEAAADRAAQVADVDIATTAKAGIVKPDGTTLDITTDGTLSAKKASATAPGIVKPDGTSLGVDNEGTIKSIVTAASLLIKDNQELVVPKVEDVAQDTTTQLLIDAIADKVANQLVSNDTFTSELAKYITKAGLDQTESTATNNAPSSAYLKEIKDELSGDISELTSSIGIHFAFIDQFKTTAGESKTLNLSDGLYLLFSTQGGGLLFSGLSLLTFTNGYAGTNATKIGGTDSYLGDATLTINVNPDKKSFTINNKNTGDLHHIIYRVYDHNKRS